MFHEAVSEASVYKNYWFWVAVIVVAGFLIFFIRFDLPQPTASLIIDFENGATRKFEGTVEPGMTIIRAVYAASLGGRFELKYHIDSGGNVDLASIGKFANVGGHGWRFYINDKPVETRNLDRVKVRTGDAIEAKYE